MIKEKTVIVLEADLRELIQKVENIENILREKKDDFPKLVSGKKAAELLDCSKQTIVENKELPKYRIGRLIKYKIDDLKKIIKPA